MNAYKRISTISGWVVFAIATIVYYFSAERTGSLWDCGEFILGAYKMQVVHPPGAPLFLLIGRIFTWFAELFSNNPEDIAFAVNFMSSLCTAFAAAFGTWITITFGKLILVGRDGETDTAQNIALAGAGIVAGLAATFSTSIWFSAVEGEVYAMSLFFTTLTLWATVKWYALPDKPENDRWLIFAIYSVGLSIGVHLLSLLTLPALAILFYFKKYPKVTWRGMAIAAGIGVVIIGLIQILIITGLPRLWAGFEIFAVNTLGMGFHTGIIFMILLVVAVIGGALYYAHINKNPLVQNIAVAAMLVVAAYSTYGVVVMRAQASPPINMNVPDDATRLLPYLNREQYGERPLLRGPHFEGQVASVDYSDRYGRVGDHYEIVDQKISYEYDNRDKMLLPRMSDPSQSRPALYKTWMGLDPNQPLPPNRPNQWDNIKFFWRYQMQWMYWRYFFWNFAGRQNGEQGFYPWDKSAGHWISGITPLDNLKLGNQSKLPESMRNDKARNKYFMLPFLFGLLGLVLQISSRRNDFIALLTLFIITGIGIIVYSNQPPNEPRERDYVLVGSFFTYCIWMGLGVLALFQVIRERLKLSGPISAGLASAVVLIAPLLMGFQNFDDHSRMEHKASRDYAANFLQSCAPNSILFTYGDNDTYPLWYAQEVEGIRTDVRVVNLSLIAVDWYINLLRRKINESPAVKLTISADAYRGSKRNQVLLNKDRQQMTLQDYIRFIGEDHPLPLQGGRMTESYLPTDNVYLPVNKQEILDKGILPLADTSNIVTSIPVKLTGKNYLTKDDIAILDIIASNLWDRPIYFAVTTRVDKMLGFDKYCQLEGMALRLIPVRTEGDPQFGSMLGAGRVATDLITDNILNKFRWGNFDKEDLYVNRSYGPSVQSQQFLMVRTGEALNAQGRKEEAVEIADQYFEAFPHMNFPFDYQTAYMIDVYIDAGAYEKAKPYIETLTQEIADRLTFYNSLDPVIVNNSYQRDNNLSRGTMTRLLAIAQQADDEEMLAKMQALFSPFLSLQNNNNSNVPTLQD